MTDARLALRGALRVVDGEPALRLEAAQHVVAVLVSRGLDVLVPALWPQIPARERSEIALEIRNVAADDRPFDADVLVGRRLRLRTEGEARRLGDQLPLARSARG